MCLSYYENVTELSWYAECECWNSFLICKMGFEYHNKELSLSISNWISSCNKPGNWAVSRLVEIISTAAPASNTKCHSSSTVVFGGWWWGCRLAINNQISLYCSEIRRMCRPGQQKNIFCIKEGPNNTRNMEFCIILLKNSSSQVSNKGKNKDLNTTEI